MTGRPLSIGKGTTIYQLVVEQEKMKETSLSLVFDLETSYRRILEVSFVFGLLGNIPTLSNIPPFAYGTHDLPQKRLFYIGTFQGFKLRFGVKNNKLIGDMEV